MIKLHSASNLHPHFLNMCFLLWLQISQPLMKAACIHQQ